MSASPRTSSTRGVSANPGQTPNAAGPTSVDKPLGAKARSTIQAGR
jgi:hypothetical protein